MSFCPTDTKTLDSDYSDDIGELNNLRRCQGICGPNHYIDLDMNTNPPTIECRSCDDINDDPDNESRNQCRVNNPVNWFEEQKSMNVSQDAQSVLRKNWSKSETVTFFGKLGYSNPKLDYDDDYYVSIDGGIMYGFQANFENIQVSYTIHQGEISDWYDSIDVDFNRFVLYYAF